MPGTVRVFVYKSPDKYSSLRFSTASYRTVFNALASLKAKAALIKLTNK